MSTLSVWRRRPAATPFTTRSPARSWRITTAVRAFALAVAAGQVLGNGVLGQAAVVLLGLAIVGAAACVMELQATGRRASWAHVAEGVIVGVLIGATASSVTPLLIYVAAPAVVAGIRYGQLVATNTWLATTATLLAAQVTGLASEQAGARGSAAAPWLVGGLGAALLAGSQTVSVRRLEAAQAPFAAAHRLVGQLHTLVRDEPAALDAGVHSKNLQRVVGASLGARRSAVLVCNGQEGLETLTSTGLLDEDHLTTARQCIARAHPIQRSGVAALPLRVGDHVFGVLLLDVGAVVDTDQLRTVQEQTDEHAIRLETALLVEDVRALATTEERNRVARDIHDGVAQRIVSLGYRVDDVVAVCSDSAAREGVEELRNEVTNLIRELRFSVFDLRHDIDEAGSLSGALSEYVRELSTRSNLRVHLTLDERGPRLTRRVENELLRIAQEAVGNVHKHARAINVWVGLTVNGTDVRLVVEDDGVGGATPRAGHYGLHTMRERAERINADLEVDTRHDGGTVVTLRSRPTVNTTKGAIRHDQHLARR